MAKLIFFLLIVLSRLTATTLDDDKNLEKECLMCHTAQQIPDELIYRRYLMVYSTSERMEKAIFLYMKNPDKKNSVMHHPFFFKFPMKEKLDLNDVTLKKMISQYLIKFDVKNKFKTIE